MARQTDNSGAFGKVITSLASEAVLDVEGICLPDSKKSHGSISVYFLPDDNVNVECFVNIEPGYTIPQAVSKLQENVKVQIERTTKFKVHSVNVYVMNVAGEQL